jgi:very-long-chain enoyl-CoA reductase
MKLDRADFWELVAWLAFSVFTQCATSYFFFLVSFAQIFEWAIKKHKQYRQEFKDYPRRKALIPLLI